MTIWLNGQLLEQGYLDASSAGATLGWGVFTTVGIKDGVPQFLRRHIERLVRDAHAAEVPLHYSCEDMEAALHAVLGANSVVNGLARFTATRRSDGRLNEDEGSDLSVMAHETAVSNTCLRVQLSPYRVEAQSPLVGVKTTSYLSYLWVWRHAKAAGFDETILLEGQNFLSEAARSNLFWIKDGELFTPSLETGCLCGLGRQLILEWAQANQLPINEGQFPSNQALEADHAYLVAAATGPRPIESWHDEKGTPLRQWQSGARLTEELKVWWQAKSASEI